MKIGIILKNICLIPFLSIFFISFVHSQPTFNKKKLENFADIYIDFPFKKECSKKLYRELRNKEVLYFVHPLETKNTLKSLSKIQKKLNECQTTETLFLNFYHHYLEAYGKGIIALYLKYSYENEKSQDILKEIKKSNERARLVQQKLNLFLTKNKKEIKKMDPFFQVEILALYGHSFYNIYPIIKNQFGAKQEINNVILKIAAIKNYEKNLRSQTLIAFRNVAVNSSNFKMHKTPAVLQKIIDGRKGIIECFYAYLIYINLALKTLKIEKAEQLITVAQKIFPKNSLLDLTKKKAQKIQNLF